MASTRQAENRILVVDPDDAFSRVLTGVLGPGYALRNSETIEGAIAELESDEVDVILLNLDQPVSRAGGKTPAAFMEAAALIPLTPPIIVYGWDARRAEGLEALRRGALDVFDQPLDVRALKFALDRAATRASLERDLATAQAALFRKTNLEGLIGHSKAMQQVNEVTRKVAGVFTNVLITGESGTGKELVARAIHRLSPRADRPFAAFSPCALPDTLMEDELFGHEKGAFTGASQVRRGRFEEARGGSIFLDEIGDLALPLQAKLLRVIQERTVERLGSNVPIPIDVRIICATSRNLEKMVREGTFREDLYFRISVVKIHLPPLRERGDDVPVLAEHFLRMFAKTHGKQLRGFTPAFLSAIASYSWPGNVRELQNVMERSLVLANGTDLLGVEDLPPELRGLVIADTPMPLGSFHQAIRSFKRELVRSALRLHNGNKLKAARELRISRCYLHRLLNQLNIVESEIDPVTVEPAPAAASTAETPALATAAGRATTAGAH